MDINALLSPDASSASQSASRNASNLPRKGRVTRSAGGKRTSSGLSQEVHRSPDRTGPSHPTSPSASADGESIQDAVAIQQSAYPLHPIAEAVPTPPNSRPMQQHQTTPTSNPTPISAYAPNGQAGQHQMQKPSGDADNSSSSQMDTLPDWTSMQYGHEAIHAYPAQNVQMNRHADIVEAQRSPTSSKPPPPPQTSSGYRLADLTMAEASLQTPLPRNLATKVVGLRETEVQTVTDLLAYLGKNSYAYDSHVQLIGLLRQGFLAHVYPPEDAAEPAPREPRSSGLLTELRQAREAMDSRFAMGEDLWLEWLTDEQLLARTGEERIMFTELSQKAVQDEPASVKLWQVYAEFMQGCYAACNDLEGSEQRSWTDEDKELCRDLFTREMLMNVLEQGISATQWRIDESHLLWNHYARLVQEDLPEQLTVNDVERIRNLFLERLQVPHVVSDETKQMFWPIVDKTEPTEWETIMEQVSEMAEPARKQVALREERELAVQRAAAGDKKTLFAAFSAYLHWERKHLGCGPFAVELCAAVYERALLRFPTHTEWWLDYVDLTTSNSPQSSILPLIERAIRHCPWSGDLWAKCILRSDVEGKHHDDIEATKRRATNSGLVESGGMEELLKVLQQWCSYLRRHAFSVTSSEDDVDTAEVGVTQALEDVSQAGKTIYGADFKGDPLYRLETIQVKFFTESRRIDSAREVWRRLVATQKDSYEFWNKYYTWEILIWGLERRREAHRIETEENAPTIARAVVQEALRQRNLDWPEKVLEIYHHHFQQHESGGKLQSAMIDAREFGKQLAVRRSKEAEAAAAESAVQQPVAAVQEVQAAVENGGKRKADETLTSGESSKKTKTEAAPAVTTTASSPAMKRDREHNTITVRNLPLDVQQLDIKKFFRDVGQPLSINIFQDAANDTVSATVEFGEHEDILAAKTRNGRVLNGREVRIASGSQNTLYVANYPPEFDESAIRGLFDSYGEILSVRFPSLKYNNRRRFCYVQFLTEEMAGAAEKAMDSKALDGQHRLLAKISNPEAKKARSGAQAEGREVFVKNIDRSASDSEVKDFFRQYGEVVSMNLLKLVNNKKTGTGFIVFVSAEEANAALAANSKPFKDRILRVEMSTTKAEGKAEPRERARKTDVIVKLAASASPEPNVTNGRRGSDVSMQFADQVKEEAFRTARERKIAIFGLPDTVNDARIRAAMERYGPIVKIQLRYEDRGAIVEFVNTNDAFNVREGVDVSSLGPEAKTGDVADLLSKAKRKQEAREAAPVPTPAMGVGMRPPVSRPTQRGGRRGGLGYKRVGGFGADRAESNGAMGRKSNADFRAMLEQSKSVPTPAAEQPEGEY